MPPKKKPTPQRKQRGRQLKKRAPGKERKKKMTATEDPKNEQAQDQTANQPKIAKPGFVTQSSTPEAGPMAHVDPGAQQRVQDALNERVAREQKVPFKPPQLPPGLSPNQILAMAAGGGVQIPPQGDEPQEVEEEELEPQTTKKK